jgi:hypothetical protein
MRILTAHKGDSYEQTETDIRAVLNIKGGKLLDIDNCFKQDTEIHFIKKARA